MGEVYKARDTRLDRIVAIKLSAEQFSASNGQERVPLRLPKFSREYYTAIVLQLELLCFLAGPAWLHNCFARNALKMLSDITPIVVRAISVSSRAHLKQALNKLYYLLSNRRIFDRVRVDHEVMITWRDRNGEGLTKGVCRDISPAGIGILCPEPIPIKTNVRLRIGPDIAVIPAVVRRQMQNESSFVVGMAFTRAMEHHKPKNSDELDLATDGMTW